MKCPKCQFENREEANFCGECGHRFDLSCPKCGTKISTQRKFCDECGYELKFAKKASAKIIETASQPTVRQPKKQSEMLLLSRERESM